jgi:hypothetical protein
MTTAIQIERPDEATIQAETNPILLQAKAIVVTDQASFDAAAQFRRRIVTAIAKAEERFAPAKTAANKAHKEICALEKKIIAPLEAASRDIENKGVAWYREEQDRIQAKAREQQEAARKAEEERRLQEAVEAESAGDTEQAEAIINAPPAQVAVIAPPAPKVAGTSVPKTYSAQVVDIMALCRAVAEGKASSEFIEPNMVALNRVAKALKKTMDIPGVVAVESMSMRSTRLS